MKSAASVLLADDEKTIRDLFSKILREAGYDVLLAKDGMEAVELARRQQIDIALLDIKMPKTDGVEALKNIKEIDKDIEIILVTGFASLDSAIEAVKGDACDYLTKPLDNIEDLVAAVGRALYKRKQVNAKKQGAMFDKLPVLASGQQMQLMELKDIYYCDAVQHHARVHCFNREFLTDFSLGELEKRLEGKLFVRVHRSYLVNLENAIEVVFSGPQEVYIVLADAKATKIRVSRYRIEYLKEVLGIPSFRSSLQN